MFFKFWRIKFPNSKKSLINCQPRFFHYSVPISQFVDARFQYRKLRYCTFHSCDVLLYYGIDNEITNCSHFSASLLQWKNMKYLSNYKWRILKWQRKVSNTSVPYDNIYNRLFSFCSHFLETYYWQNKDIEHKSIQVHYSFCSKIQMYNCSYSVHFLFILSELCFNGFCCVRVLVLRV